MFKNDKKFWHHSSNKKKKDNFHKGLIPSSQPDKASMFLDQNHNNVNSEFSFKKIQSGISEQSLATIMTNTNTAAAEQLATRDYYNLPPKNSTKYSTSASSVRNQRQTSALTTTNTINDCNNSNNSNNKCNFEIQCQNGLRKLHSNGNMNNVIHNNSNNQKGNCHNNSYSTTNNSNILGNTKSKNKRNIAISRSVDDLRLEDNLFTFEASSKYNKGYYNNQNNSNIIQNNGHTNHQSQLASSNQKPASSASSSLQKHTKNHQIHYQHNYQKQKSALYQIKNKHFSMDNLLTAVDTHFGITSYQNDTDRPQFVAVTSLDECQAVRCAEFHPSGKLYAVGSNSKTLRICEYPSLSDIREDHTTYQPTILYERPKYHKGSIYCMDWSPDGELIATGSNDKTIKLMRYNSLKKQLEGRETELTMHDGTVRDICFIEDSSNKASLLISGGAGDNKIYVTDCATATPFQSLGGHGSHILSLFNWGGAMFVSGSQDKTIRFWDLRTRQCVNTITPATTAGSRQGSAVAAVSVDPSGRLLVSGHEDSSVVLYDIRGNRPIQCFKPHTADIRSIRFSPSAYYLLTGGYDKKLVLTDLQGDLTLPLPSVVVAHHADKVISGRWHPSDFSFLSTSADKTAVLWALSSKP